MDMVGHQTPGINLNLQLPGPVSQRIEVVTIIAVTDENGISIMTALNHVMWHIRDHHPANPWHCKLLLQLILAYPSLNQCCRVINTHK
jgi:hypothetical protein